MAAKTTISHDLIAELPELEGRFGEMISPVELSDVRKRAAKAAKGKPNAAAAAAAAAPASKPVSKGKGTTTKVGSVRTTKAKKAAKRSRARG